MAYHPQMTSEALLNALQLWSLRLSAAPHQCTLPTHNTQVKAKFADGDNVDLRNMKKHEPAAR
jgi:hypothetical protein